MPVNDGAPEIAFKGAISGLMVGTPMYGGLCHDAYLLGMLDLQHLCIDMRVPLATHTIRNESLIHRARNRILRDFIDSSCSHLIFIDADIGFVGRDVFRLVAHGKEMAGATYAKKNREKYDPALVPLDGPSRVTDDHLIEVACLPGGFLMLHRDVVNRLIGVHQDLWYWDHHETGRRRVHDLSACYIDPVTRTMWSEDYALCQRWRAMGGQVWLDPNISLSHNGTSTFEGDPRSVFVSAPAAPEPAVPLPQGRAPAPPHSTSAASRAAPAWPGQMESPVHLYAGPLTDAAAEVHKPKPAAHEPATVADHAPAFVSVGQGDLRPVRLVHAP